ncbi:MAG: hypothetical protein EXX96DRAFT_650805 [Benjaminiella poitrasii]|nr:MAG: hypothetical protein EXX96DRAFT_650805 [Benjaminiella poitrasii]
MHELPDELILRIFTHLANDIKQLIRISQISKRFNRIIEDPKLWYSAFQARYPIWGNRVAYSSNSKHLIDWKDFVIHLLKQQKTTHDFSFEFVHEQPIFNPAELTKAGRKRRMTNEEENDILLPPALSQDDEDDSIPFWIQDPLVVDIDRINKTGIVATGKHRRRINQHGHLHSEHKILFWEYPSWRLVRTFHLNLSPSALTCQIIGIQTIQMPCGKGTQKVRFFSLAVGQALMNGMDANDGNEDRVDVWKSLFVYRLFEDGSTQCVAHINITELFLGREVFLFSDTSWSQSSGNGKSKLKDWMKIVSPENADYDPRFTVFLIAMGPVFERITGCVQVARFDIRGQHNILDPSLISLVWDDPSRSLKPFMIKDDEEGWFTYDEPIEMIHSIRLGMNVSCMIHFKYPPELNHLVCTGSYSEDELSIYDWRFGVKVGTLPWKTILVNNEDNNPDFFTTALSSTNLHHNDLVTQQQMPFVRQNRALSLEQQAGRLPNEVQEERRVILGINNNGNNDFLIPDDEEMHNGEEDEEEEDDDEDDNLGTLIDVRPWGLECTLVLPPYWSTMDNSEPIDSLAQHGFRLIAVGDNRNDNAKDKLEIKVWDISYLLQVKWDPLAPNDENYALLDSDNSSLAFELSQRFPWWPRRTQELTRLALNMVWQTSSTMQPASRRRMTEAIAKSIYLPYSPPDVFQSMILAHTFDKDSYDQQDIMPVKYTAYNVLYTSLFLLTEDGKMTVMDIESGEITGTVDNVAATTNINHRSISGRVKGIDVNVIGGKEVVVTSREGLLRGTVF